MNPDAAPPHSPPRSQPQNASARMKAVAAFLFQNPETYALFPSSALRDEYVRLCAGLTGACAAGSYIKFGALQEMLCRAAHGGALRMLTHAERINAACEFLFEKGVREAVLALERCEASPAADSFAYAYAPKLLRIFSHYPRIRALKEGASAQKREAFKNVFGLLQRYEEFLRGRGCIDSAAAMFLMYEAPAAYASMPPLRIAPFAPGLFSKTARLFLRGAQGLPAFTCLQFDAPNTPGEQSSESSPENFFKNDAAARAAWPATSEEALALLAPDGFAEASGGPVKKTALRFANAAQELNAVFARIAGLIKNGVLPRNIACSIADLNPSMRAEIGSLSTKYDVPAALISGRRESPILQSFLQSIEACLETNMHPEALRETLMIAGVPWKNRRAIIELIAVGMRETCVDGERLERWRRALSQADKRAGFETDEPRERAEAEFQEEPDAENAAEHSEQALHESGELFFEEEQEPAAPPAPEVPEQPISLKKFFFSLRKAFMELRGARTYAQLHRAFSYLRRAFMRMPAPKNENTVMPRIAEIIRELLVHERERAARGMRASPWRVLCSVALTRSGEHFLDANAVGVYALEDSVGIWREHHFFVHLAHNSITKSSEDQPVFGSFADARLFDAPDPAEHAARETLFRAAAERGGAHVYVSASDEDYGGDMRLAPHDIGDEDDVSEGVPEDALGAASEDVFETEQALWAAPVKKDYSGYYWTPAQRRGLASREGTLARRNVSCIAGGVLPQAAPVIRRYAEAQGIRGRNAALLMADPAHFLLQEIFGAQNLFQSLDENLHDKMDFGTLFHDIAREAFAHTAAMRAAISEDAAREIIEHQMQKSRAHVMVRPSLKSLFSRAAAARMVQRLCAFAWEKAGEDGNSIEPEKTLAGSLAALCGGAFDTALSGRADLVIAAAPETNEAPAEQCSARAFFIVDYKKKAQDVQDFPQAWLYSLMLGSNNAENTNGAEKPAGGAPENQQAGIALFDIGKNLLDFEKKHDARLDFITPENKKIPEVVACYKDLLRESFAGLCEARFTPLADASLAAVRGALREAVLQAPYFAESRALIWRDGCYAYPNKVFAPTHASS